MAPIINKASTVAFIITMIGTGLFLIIEGIIGISITDDYILFGFSLQVMGPMLVPVVLLITTNEVIHAVMIAIIHIATITVFIICIIHMGAEYPSRVWKISPSEYCGIGIAYMAICTQLHVIAMLHQIVDGCVAATREDMQPLVNV